MVKMLSIKNRRLRVIGFAFYGLKILWYLIRTGKLRMAYNFWFVSMFSRDSGLALLDPFFNRFPWLNPYPWCLEVETSTACNLRCEICEHTYWLQDGKFKPQFMSFEQFKHIVDQFPRLKRIGPSGIGASFLNRDYLKMLEYVKKKRCYVEIFESFSHLKEHEIQALVDLEIDKIWVSIEAATKETYEKIRAGASFERTIANIRRLAQLRDQAGKPLPQLAFHFIITKHNLHEMMAYVDLVKDIIGDTDRHGTHIFFTALLYFPEVEHLRVAVPPELKEEVDARCRQYNIFCTWSDNITCDQPARKCMRWNEPYVLVTGDVQCCCGINEANQRPYQIEHAFGNLLKVDFKDLWYSDAYGKFRKALRADVFPPLCKYCRAYRAKNSIMGQPGAGVRS